MTSPAAPGLSELEIASGSVFGPAAGVGPVRAGTHGPSVRAALELSVLAGLRRPPCVVSFSGGRDSSAVLAVATHVARREGLPLPVPVTLRFPDSAESREDDWQQTVIDHLGLVDWDRITLTDELDAVGPLAQQTLRTHGLQWPFNAYFHVPVMAAAVGGSVLTGVGGDQVFAAGVWHRENLVLSGRRRPSPLDPVRIALGVAPRPVRRAYLDRRVGAGPHPRTWLTLAAATAVQRARLTDLAADSISHRTSLQRVWWQSRSRVLGQASLAALAAERDVLCLSPLTSEAVVAAVVREQGWRSYDNRSRAMAALVGDLLPAPLVQRSTKGSFGSVFAHRHTRAFAAAWDGSGVDTSLVDPRELRRVWARPDGVDARTMTVLQAAWLRTTH